MGMDKPIEKKKWPPKKIITYVVSASFIILAIYAIFFSSSSSELNVKEERISISTVKSGPFQEFIPVIGNVKPQNTIFLDAVEGGRVEKIFLRAGSLVNKGDKILKLSNTQLMMTLLNNEAQINRATNDLRSTRLLMEQNRLDLEKQRAEVDYNLTRIKRKFDRNKVLYEEKLISKQDFEDFKDEFEYLTKKQKLTVESQEKELKFQEQQVKDLENSVNQMKGNLNLLQQQMENLTVRAPIKGHLTSLDLELGESKSAGERLGQIDELDGFKVKAEIDEHYINRIQVGKVGKFDFDGETNNLKISKVFPEVKEGRFEVELEFEGKEPPNIRRGLTLHIRLELSETSEALLLARGGFYQVTGGNWVFVVDSSGNTAVKRDIRLGRQNPQYFEVLEGLNEGERVITSSYENYKDMDQLNLK